MRSTSTPSNTSTPSRIPGDMSIIDIVLDMVGFAAAAVMIATLFVIKMMHVSDVTTSRVTIATGIVFATVIIVKLTKDYGWKALGAVFGAAMILITIGGAAWAVASIFS